MFFVLFQRRCVIELGDNAVDTRADKAVALQILKHMQVFTFAFAHHRRKDHDFAAFRQRQNLIDHLADGLRLQFFVVSGAKWLTRPCKQQAQVVINLGNSAHGGARVM